tara:strand:- start:20744 stop:20977 length:234 start_codon:yes stop_codon:yes gene_type:complete
LFSGQISDPVSNVQHPVAPLYRLLKGTYDLPKTVAKRLFTPGVGAPTIVALYGLYDLQCSAPVANDMFAPLEKLSPF